MRRTRTTIRIMGFLALPCRHQQFILSNVTIRPVLPCRTLTIKTFKILQSQFNNRVLLRLMLRCYRLAAQWQTLVTSFLYPLSHIHILFKLLAILYIRRILEGRHMLLPTLLVPASITMIEKRQLPVVVSLSSMKGFKSLRLMFQNIRLAVRPYTRVIMPLTSC